MSKIVFLDVDGTLIDYEAKLPASAAKAVVQDVQKQKSYKEIYVI